MASVMTRPSVAPDVPDPKEIPPYPGDIMITGKGPKVGTWQYALRRRGYDIGDAEFGPGTNNIVRDWQKKHGLTVDGIAGKKTWDSLWNDPSPPGKGDPPKYRKAVRKGDKGVAVGDFHFALRRRGYDIVDAVFGPNTNHIMRDWQSKHGLKVDGVGGPKTWHSLWHDK